MRRAPRTRRTGFRTGQLRQRPVQSRAGFCGTPATGYTRPIAPIWASLRARRTRCRSRTNTAKAERPHGSDPISARLVGFFVAPATGAERRTDDAFLFRDDRRIRPCARQRTLGRTGRRRTPPTSPSRCRSPAGARSTRSTWSTRPTARSTPTRTNAVLVCHALNASHHVAGFYAGDEPDNVGWWDNMVGPGKPLDTDRFFVVGVNNLGSCFGSSGPTTINPATGQRRARFPGGHGRGLGHAQARLADRLGIERFAGGDGRQPRRHAGAATGPSSTRERVAPCARHRRRAEPVGAEHRVQRGRAPGDPHRPGFPRRPLLRRTAWCRGAGLRVARMIGHITYLSDDAMAAKFGRAAARRRLQFSFDVEFQIESYLRYQGEKFSELLRRQHLPADHQGARLLRPGARDRRRPGRARSRRPTASSSSLSFTTDWRFSPERSREIVKALLDNRRDVSYAEIEAPHGHDAFLLDDPQYHARGARVLRPRPQGLSTFRLGRRSTTHAQRGRGRAPTTRPSPTGCRPGAACSTWAAATAACSRTCSPRAQRQGYGVEIDGRGVLRVRRERRQRDPAQHRGGLRRLRRRLVRRRRALADAAGDAQHRGCCARCCASAAKAIVSFPNFGHWSHRAADPARAHAGLRATALPVVRHAERAPVHGRGLRRLPGQARLRGRGPRRACRRPTRSACCRTCSASSRSTGSRAAANPLRVRGAAAAPIQSPLDREARRLAIHHAAAALQAVLGRAALFLRGLSARHFLRHLPGLVPPAGRRVAQHRPASACSGWRGRSNSCGRRRSTITAATASGWPRVDVADGRGDARLRHRRGPAAVGVARHRHLHRAVGDQRHRHRRLHHRAAEPRRNGARQRRAHRFLPRRHAGRRRSF